MKKRALFLTGLILVVALVLTLSGCGEKKAEEVERTDLILATTTSTQDTGLLDEWVPMFEADNPYAVKVIAVGSGAAMEMGKNGEADVLLVHSPAAEEQLVADGYAIDRNAVMHNDFILVGPASDSANLKDSSTAGEAFTAIAESGSKFISRADDSGTHVKELAVWKAADITPAGAWYVEAGKGMGDTLRIGSEEEAYVLTDRGTYLSLRGELDLDIILEGDPILFNNYHVMNVNPEKWPDVNFEGAKAFNAFCISREAQEFLKEFGVEKFGQPLFYADAL